MKTNPYDAAMPAIDEAGQFNFGITKLEYFTAAALQGLLANPHFAKSFGDDEKAFGSLMSEIAIMIANKTLRDLDNPVVNSAKES